MITTAMPVSLAKVSSLAVHSRTCPTLPAAVSSSWLYMVWMESMTNSSGWLCRAWTRMVPSSVAVMICRLSVALPSRSARMAVWASDSSPDTYRTFLCRAAAFMDTSSTMVDLPMPGAPPRRIREPGTMPPPNTRSNSWMPVVSRSTWTLATWLMVLGTGRSAVWR